MKTMWGTYALRPDVRYSRLDRTLIWLLGNDPYWWTR